jgi:peptide/nickel transport system permease protein
MIRFVLRRAMQGALVMLAVVFVAFSLFRFIGNPVDSLVGQDATPRQREEIARQLGLDDPFPVQYAHYIARVARGRFGVSYRLGVPVLELIAERLPATLELSAAAMLLALALGVPLGVVAALRPNALASRAVLALSLVGISLPTFLTGILLILVFSVRLGWLPSFGRGEVVHLGAWSTGLLTASGLKALVLPATTLGLFQMTLLMRLARAQMLEVLRSDHIRFARARGLSPAAVTLRHALRNALVPVVTIAGLQLGGLIAFGIVTETVFQWPGLGLLFLQAVQFVDIPLMAAYLMLVALTFVVINLCVDLLYYAVDPRLRDRLAGGGDAS